ncbi:MAG: SMP-30/gluconolactonase/LRE family protein [Anaerolineae bacterium]
MNTIIRLSVAILLIVVLALAAVLVFVIGLQPPASIMAGDGLPDVVTFRNPRVMPEGIEWWAEENVFLHGSFSQGTIFAVEDDGTSTPFIENDDFITTVGLHIDHATNRLLIAHGDFGVFQNRAPAGPSLSLYAYDLTTRDMLFFVDMSDLVESERHFTNDVTTDANGNAYVTDSFSSVIYRVTPDGEAEAWLDYEGFGEPGLGLNGIEYHPDGYLIAANMNDQRWFKVPVDDPSGVTEIVLSEPLATDGLILHPSGALLAVSDGRVVAVTSDDDWATGTVVAESTNEGTGSATTLALREEEVYVLVAQLRNPLAIDYSIVRVTWNNAF